MTPTTADLWGWLIIACLAVGAVSLGSAFFAALDEFTGWLKRRRHERAQFEADLDAWSAACHTRRVLDDPDVTPIRRDR